MTLRVTRDFGRELHSSEDRAPLEGHGTMMRLLKGYNDVKTTYQGRLAGSIDGLTQREDLAWVSYVNGIETDLWPSEYKLLPGDVVQWDLRDWYITLDTRLTVGAFPQFFTRGFHGKRMPMRVFCEDEAALACKRVKTVLTAAGMELDGRVRPSRSTKPQDPNAPFDEVSDFDLTNRVLVGKWSHWGDKAWPKRIDRGPRYSGVFARFSPDADELRLLDWNGHLSRTERGDVGLVAAMRPTEPDFMWLVTGTTDKGVEMAARALDPDRLRDAYALAVLPGGDEKLPVEPR